MAFRGRSLVGNKFRSAWQTIRAAGAWRPSVARLLAAQLIDRSRNEGVGYSDEDHLAAAVSWLERAQDMSGDGGFCGRYHLRTGWSSSYPETTGYIIPTLLRLAEHYHDERFDARARRAVQFLLGVQLPSGAFPGGEIADNRTRPSPFNTAQIIHGLVHWHGFSGDSEALEAALRAGEWLLEMQDADGAFRRGFYGDVAATYSAHLACWLAELGRRTGERRFLDAAQRNVDWVLGHRDPQTGWIDACGFWVEDHRSRKAVTHTIAYTLWGLLTSSEILGREDGIDAVRRAAEGVLRRLELSRRLPGELNWRWRGEAHYACLTGNAQFAILWIRLALLDQDWRFLNAALKAIDLVKRAQLMDVSDPDLRGGIPGSDPIWGRYIPLAVPNWAAKYYIDALLDKKKALAAVRERPMGPRMTLPADVPTRIPQIPPNPGRSQPRIVVYTREGSATAGHLIQDWIAWDFRPAAVIVEHPRRPFTERLRDKIGEEGFGWVWRKWTRRQRLGSPPAPAEESTLALRELCRERAIPIFDVERLDGEETLEFLRNLAPDLAVFAGGGILRRRILEIPKLGTLNAHMGLLPYFRGMNVAEWAAFSGEAVGPSVYLIDEGVDTGDIICVRPLEIASCRSIAELRALVDEAQRALLSEAVRFVVATGKLPPLRKQAPSEGRQFFRMHADLARILEEELDRGRLQARADIEQGRPQRRRSSSAMSS